MKCLSCQHENKANARFCAHCGATCAIPTPPKPRALTCTNCQHGCKVEAKFCPKCGTILASPLAPTPVPASPASSKVDAATICGAVNSDNAPLNLAAKKPLLLISSAVVAGIAVLGAAGYFLLHKSEPLAPGSATTNTATVFAKPATTTLAASDYAVSANTSDLSKSTQARAAALLAAPPVTPPATPPATPPLAPTKAESELEVITDDDEAKLSAPAKVFSPPASPPVSASLPATATSTGSKPKLKQKPVHIAQMAPSHAAPALDHAAGNAVDLAIQGNLSEAAQCMNSKQYDCVIANANSVLRMAAGNRRALELKRLAKDAQDRALSQIQIQ